MSGSNCCFLTCIQITQEEGKVVWYSLLFKNFPQFVLVHRVKGFIIVSEAELDVFLEFSCFFYDPVDVDNLISGSSVFSKCSLDIWKFSVHVLLKTGLENLSITLLACATAAKSLQSCPTLCDPIDSSPSAPPFLGFSRHEHWSGLSFPSPMHESEK